MPDVVPIGRFSEMCRLSIKALRHYDDLGLLAPAYVDPDSGYRYYRPSQAAQAEAIRRLRDLDMPLDEIRTVLQAGDRAEARAALERHRRRLDDRLKGAQRMLDFLALLIDGEEEIMPHEVQVKEVASQLALVLPTTTTMSAVGETIGAGMAELYGHLATSGAQPAGPPLIVYHDTFDEERETAIEICAPIAEPVAETGRLKVAELPGGSMAFTVHRGPYREVGPAYQALSAWIAEHGHDMAGPPREIYLNDPGHVAETELLTEIDWPIA